MFLPFAQILTKLIFFPGALNFASYSVKKVRDFSAKLPTSACPQEFDIAHRVKCHEINLANRKGKLFS